MTCSAENQPLWRRRRRRCSLLVRVRRSVVARCSASRARCARATWSAARRAAWFVASAMKRRTGRAAPARAAGRAAALPARAAVPPGPVAPAHRVAVRLALDPLAPGAAAARRAPAAAHERRKPGFRRPTRGGAGRGDDGARDGRCLAEARPVPGASPRGSRGHRRRGAKPQQASRPAAVWVSVGASASFRWAILRQLVP